MWYDEVGSFYLSRLSPTEMLDLMSSNYDEDAPAFNLIQHYWQNVTQYNPILLRLLPLGFWIASIIGAGFLVNRLAGRAAMYWAVIIIAIWPYHWLFPIAMRWYSLATAAGVWNLYFFVRLIQSEQLIPSLKQYSAVIFAVMVALTGAVAWYTVYYAPVIAASELLVLLVYRFPTRAIGAWAIAWLGAVILYLPWLPTFLAQLGESTGNRFSLKHSVSSLYALWAGAFSTPTDFWISLPLLAAWLFCIVLVLKYGAKSSVPLMVGGLTFLSFILFGVIDLTRLLFITTLTAMGVGIAVGAAIQGGKPQWVRIGLPAAGVFMLIGLGGSIVNITSSTGWLTYRWTDRVEETVQLINTEHPEALILSNSSAVAFYAKDPIGSELTRYFLENDPTTIEKTKVWSVRLRSNPDYGPLMEQAIMSHRDVIYVHHAFFLHIGSTIEMESVLSWLDGMGLERVNQWGSTPISKITGRYFDLDGHPEYRLTGVLFRNPSPLLQISK